MNPVFQFMNLLYLLTMLLLPTTMIFFGILWRRSGPEKINGLYGYRTKKSMASREAWNFAHVYSAKLFLSAGIIQFILTLIVCVYYWSATDNFIGYLMLAATTVQTLSFIAIIPIVESGLKKNFDKNGKWLNEK